MYPITSASYHQRCHNMAVISQRTLFHRLSLLSAFAPLFPRISSLTGLALQARPTAWLGLYWGPSTDLPTRSKWLLFVMVTGLEATDPWAVVIVARMLCLERVQWGFQPQRWARKVGDLRKEVRLHGQGLLICETWCRICEHVAHFFCDGNGHFWDIRAHHGVAECIENLTMGRWARKKSSKREWRSGHSLDNSSTDV